MARECLPSRRGSWTQKAKIGGQTFYLSCGEYPDGRLGEIWVETKTEGSFTRGVLSAQCRMASIALQCGTPVEEVVKTFRDLSFPPNGRVEAEITSVKECSSVADWISQEIENAYVKPRRVESQKVEQEDVKAEPMIIPSEEQDSLLWYRKTATEIANLYGEPVILVMKPPPKMDSRSTIPYIVLLSQSDSTERSALHERFELT